MKRTMAALLALAVLAWGGARAEDDGVYAGGVVALTETAVLAASAGTVADVSARAGEIVSADAPLYTLAAEKVFARSDGVVAGVWCDEGEAFDGAVLQIEPVSRYIVYCTVDYAYESAASTLVHAGETLYLKCTEDGTHRGEGVVTAIEGSEYTVWVEAGEFYPGETVYLYRDAAYSKKLLVGKGTLIYQSADDYESEGVIVNLRVAAGDRVERGQLLYEVIDAESAEGAALATTAGCEGILTALNVRAGQAVEIGDVVATVCAPDALAVEAYVPEEALARFAPGNAVRVCLGGEPETWREGEVESVSGTAAEDGYRVIIRLPEDAPMRLGMTALAAP